MQTIRRSTAVLQAYISANELTALSIDHGQCYAFNVTATSIWELLEQPMTIDHLRARLLAMFETNPETFEDDLEYGLQRLKETGLVEITEADLVQSQNSGEFERR